MRSKGRERVWRVVVRLRGVRDWGRSIVVFFSLAGGLVRALSESESRVNGIVMEALTMMVMGAVRYAAEVGELYNRPLAARSCSYHHV